MMYKDELIKLAKELSELDDLSGREQDVSYLKREWRKLNSREEETFYEKTKTEEFNNYYSQLSSKIGSLFSSTYDEKKALVEKAKTLLDRNDVLKASKEMNDLFNAFKSVGRCSKEQDDELWASFKEIKDKFNEKRSSYFENIIKENEVKKGQKEALIEEAKKALEIENIKEAGKKFDSLLEEWKKIGFSGKDNDEALWISFNEIRKEFSKKRKEHFTHMKEMYVERVNKKEELINTAKKLVADADWSENELKLVKGLVAEWRTIGFAGKEHEDDLWNRFDAVIKQYYEEKKFYTC